MRVRTKGNIKFTDESLPQVLIDIRAYLEAEGVKIAEKVEGEGRHASLKDEGTIKRCLMTHPTFTNHVFDVPARGFGDIVVLDYDGRTKYPVNIKTSLGASDNATSKIGLLYAFTDMTIEELPKRMGWKRFVKLLQDRKADIKHKDYYFLCIDKSDSSNVMIRGSKQIRCWNENANPSNLLQIHWGKEKASTSVDRTYEEAYEVIINGIARCFAKHHKNLPIEWTNTF